MITRNAPEELALYQRLYSAVRDRADQPDMPIVRYFVGLVLDTSNEPEMDVPAPLASALPYNALLPRFLDPHFRWRADGAVDAPAARHRLNILGHPAALIWSRGLDTQTKFFQFGVRNVISLAPGGSCHHAARALFRNRHFTPRYVCWIVCKLVRKTSRITSNRR